MANKTGGGFALPPSLEIEMADLSRRHTALLMAGRDKSAGEVRAEARLLIRDNTRWSPLKVLRFINYRLGGAG